MNTRLLVFALFGAAVVMLFSTDKGKKIREELADAAGDWSDKLGELTEKAVCSADDLRKYVSKEVSGLSEDARERIAAIIDEGAKSAKKLKKTATA
jgi:gas vesicle protein